MITSEYRMQQIHPIAKLYRDDFDTLSSFFHYDPYSPDSAIERLKWIDGSEDLRADRAALAQVLEQYNRSVGAGERTLDHIEEISNGNAVCIIGGQQAGLLTGPIYTIYKALSLIQWARTERRNQNRPVVPVFWIAGEDHDWEEVNHVYVQDQDGQPVKLRLPNAPRHRASISRFKVEHEEIDKLLKEVLTHFPDSGCKPQLAAKIKEAADASDTLSTFFARLMAWLFEEDGLILVDAADPAIRRLEAPFFNKLIEENEMLNNEAIHQQARLRSLGLSVDVDLHPNNAHLFIYEQDDRLLLHRDEGRFLTKTGGYSYSRDELLHIAGSSPERLSTNVFFRTLMQEYLFPVLHTVLGPGEIAYWSLFGQAFNKIGLRLPIVQPRWGATIIDEYEHKWMSHYELSLDHVIAGLNTVRERLLVEQGREDWQDHFEQVREGFLRLYEPLVRKMIEEDAGLSSLAASNMERILDQIYFLESRMKISLLHRNETDLKRLSRMEHSLWPLNRPQERVYSIFYYLAKYGPEWWKQFRNHPFNVRLHHEMIYL
jgi:bacillithiol biosynthesis cysteine-adding enzyme BshC